MSQPNTSPPAPGAPKKGLSATTWTYLIGILVPIVALVVVGLVTSGGDPAEAKVGDCVDQTGSDKVKVVACDDAKAEFEVIARVEDQTRLDASVNACLRYADQGPVTSFWEGKQGGTGYVLCMIKVNR
jgi:hypothetical protein